MATVAEVLSSQQGRYEWGVRDCLTTTAAVVEFTSGIRLDFSELHAMSERRAAAAMIRRHGSLLAAHGAQMPHGYQRLPTAGPPHAGDIVPLIEIEGRELGDNAHLGFVDESCSVWTWFPEGLRAVACAWREIYRCRKPYR